MIPQKYLIGIAITEAVAILGGFAYMSGREAQTEPDTEPEKVKLDFPPDTKLTLNVDKLTLPKTILQQASPSLAQPPQPRIMAHQTPAGNVASTGNVSSETEFVRPSLRPAQSQTTSTNPVPESRPASGGGFMASLQQQLSNTKLKKVNRDDKPAKQSASIRSNSSNPLMDALKNRFKERGLDKQDEEEPTSTTTATAIPETPKPPQKSIYEQYAEDAVQQCNLIGKGIFAENDSGYKEFYIYKLVGSDFYFEIIPKKKENAQAPDESRMEYKPDYETILGIRRLDKDANKKQILSKKKNFIVQILAEEYPVPAYKVLTQIVDLTHDEATLRDAFKDYCATKPDKITKSLGELDGNVKILVSSKK